MAITAALNHAGALHVFVEAKDGAVYYATRRRARERS